MIIRAYAKVNIALKILGKRPDGYHELVSFMQALPDLYDVLEIVEAEETEISCSDETLSCGEDNLVVKALKLAGKKAKVHIEKKIPIAAGLAGGSADAAAILYAFLGASKESYDIASKIGADVPFSLMAIHMQGKCAAIASRTGTDLKPVEPFKGTIITKTPNIAVSTADVYKEYDKMQIKGESLFGNIDFSNISPQEFALKYDNDLQKATLKLFPQIQNTIDELSKVHPQYGKPIKVQQSGSGPTCFAIYQK